MLNTTKKPILLVLLIVLGSIAGCLGNDEEETGLETLTVAFEVKDDYTNVDENPQTPLKYNVRSIPTLLLLKGESVEGQQIGAVAKGALASFIDKHIS